MFLEAEAGWLAVVHAVVGAFVVATSTHLVVWLRGWRRGRFVRVAGVRRFAWLTLGGYLAAFALGNLIYPVYKARVRVEYLDNPSAIVADLRTREASAAGMADVTATPARALGPADPVAHHARLARWFDVKEQWVLVGLLLAFAVALVLRSWDPPRDGPGPLPLVLGGAIAVAAIAWSGAVIGLVVASVRGLG